MKLRIGITQRQIVATQANFARDALDAAWAAWFCGHLPLAQFVAIPNFADPMQAKRFVQDWDVNFLLLSGGEDIGLSGMRDAVEMHLLAWAEQRCLPVMGVCRGMQMLHHRSDGQLIRLPGHLACTHALQSAKGALRINSWHNFGIMQLAQGWQAVAHAADGSVEAMRHDHLPWLGMMWHPERENGKSEILSNWMETLTT